MSKSVFLSHAANDKAFARRLAKDIERAGGTAWLDEAEVRIGDSLIERISHAISSTDFVAAVLSPCSVASQWVKTELRLAMTSEIAGRSVKVLPLLYRDCVIPEFLVDKKYADFRDEANYEVALSQILEYLDLDRSPPGTGIIQIASDTYIAISRFREVSHLNSPGFHRYASFLNARNGYIQGLSESITRSRHAIDGYRDRTRSPDNDAIVFLTSLLSRIESALSTIERGPKVDEFSQMICDAIAALKFWLDGRTNGLVAQQGGPKPPNTWDCQSY